MNSDTKESYSDFEVVTIQTLKSDFDILDKGYANGAKYEETLRTSSIE